MRKLGPLLCCLLTVLHAHAEDLTVGESLLLKELKQENIEIIRLWPKGIGPDESGSYSEVAEKADHSGTGGVLKIREVSKPSLIVIPPPKGVRPNGTALIFCPGGGYNSLHFGPPLMAARWFGAIGGTIAILKYRVPRRPDDKEIHKLPLQDAQRALGILRSRADNWGLDPKKIGIAGSSAGGHLAYNLCNHFDKRNYIAVDKSDNVSCRPDYALLFFPFDTC